MDPLMGPRASAARSGTIAQQDGDSGGRHRPRRRRYDDGAHDPRPIFAAMFTAVRAYLLGAGGESGAAARVATNPKGEATRAFDAMAERIALDVARDGLGGFRAFSE